MNLNKAMLIGRLGRDPELRYTKSGDAVCNFTLATSETWKDKSGAKQEKTEWHKVVAFRQPATFAGEYLRKGDLVYAEGKLQTRKWEKDGVDHFTTEVVAHIIRKLSSKGDAQPQALPEGNEPEIGPYMDSDIPF